ncbi:internal virion protein [Cetacean poxvirus 1]|nr:internal virion protein [Cetacean poxvirus 1]
MSGTDTARKYMNVHNKKKKNHKYSQYNNKQDVKKDDNNNNYLTVKQENGKQPVLEQYDRRDFLNTRICDQERESICLEGYSIPVNCFLKQASDDELSCWAELSSMVNTRRSLGFYLLRGSKNTSAGRILYFEQFKSNVKKLTPGACISEYILFQMTIILYMLYKRGIFADNINFDLLVIPRTTFLFSVNQLIFQFSTDVLVLLSLSVRPYRVELSQSCYLDYLKNFFTLSHKCYESSNYFIEWLLHNHFGLLTKQSIDIFKIKKKYIPSVQLTHHTEPGTLVYVLRDDSYIIGITLTNVSISNNIRVLYSMDGGNVLEIDDFYLNDIFIAGEVFIRSQTSSIII